MSLIEASELKQWLDRGDDFLLFDCRFDLVDSEAGYKSYLEGHIPGAIYIHSDKDLATTKNAYFDELERLYAHVEE
jgi:thiosulfate/3-mercaptopyruvate sulfurtransferase